MLNEQEKRMAVKTLKEMMLLRAKDFEEELISKKLNGWDAVEQIEEWSETFNDRLRVEGVNQAESVMLIRLGIRMMRVLLKKYARYCRRHGWETDIQFAIVQINKVAAGLVPFTEPVSYTHLTLPTIYSV